jgi:hypothetical protein
MLTELQLARGMVTKYHASVCVVYKPIKRETLRFACLLAHIALAELPFPAFPQISALFSFGVAGNTEGLHMHSRTSALFKFGIAWRVNPLQTPQNSPEIRALFISGIASELTSAGSVTFSPKYCLGLPLHLIGTVFQQISHVLSPAPVWMWRHSQGSLNCLLPVAVLPHSVRCAVRIDTAEVLRWLFTILVWRSLTNILRGKFVLIELCSNPIRAYARM